MDGLGDAYADDLVADALADTPFGVIAWDPNAKLLYDHGTRSTTERATRYQAKRMDAIRTGDAQATRGLVEVSLQQDHAAESADTARGAVTARDQK